MWQSCFLIHNLIFMPIFIVAPSSHKCVVESFVVACLVWGAVYGEFDDFELVHEVGENVFVRFGDDGGVVPERAAAECAEYDDVGSVCGGDG